MKPELRNAIIVIALVFGLSAAVVHHLNQADVMPDPITPARRLEMLRLASVESFAKSVTNDVVGYRRTITSGLDNYDADVGKWSAFAEVEFYNRSGGVERTNLRFVFEPHFFLGDAITICRQDRRLEEAAEREISRQIELRKLDQFNADFRAALEGKKRP